MCRMIHPDQKYIQALADNDERLVDELYRKFFGKIKWMVLKNNGDESDAADIFQDALMSLFYKARAKNFALSCPLDAFLYLVCKNKWLTELSKRKSHPVTMIDAPGYSISAEDTTRCAEEHILREARNDLVVEKLKSLGDGCRQLLQLNWSGKSLEEVAVALNVTYGYVRKKKSECMSRLISLVKAAPEYRTLQW